ncbi:MAG TPA: asparagine synthase (glutamine-hydrolyzing) [Planctomycetota bacterium]|nr:asparagine synthase (glutamine-hydrolyzing) [Planctomycetota bacterium]
MCGIAGVLHFDPERRADPALLGRMTRSIAHRGPDDEGFHFDGALGLGHRRLSIIDLAGGAQPMSNEDGTVWIVFNGEIFNFQDLRPDLEAAGHVFRTRSDTECIVHLYEEHGSGCAARLVGQFAFAIWDSRRRCLFLARDHVGIKPLFYSTLDDRLLFASELKALLQDETVPREVNGSALIDYLTYRYVPSPGTIFKGIRKLPPGHHLLWEKGRVRVERFWEMPLGGPPPGSEGECAEKLDALLNQAVKSQLMSEVPLGAFLSGGIDSSILVGLMAGLLDRPPKTFTIGFREEDFSEITHARKAADMHGTEHRELYVEPESVEVLPRIVRQLDEPFADPSAIPTYYLARMAREHVTVALSGDGGDEAFAGYRRYEWALRYSRLDMLPGALRSPLFRALERLLPAGRWRRAARRLALDPGSRYADLFGCLWGQDLHSLLSPELRETAAARPDASLFLELYEGGAKADRLMRLQRIDIASYLPDDILVKTDRMSMLNSLEVRVPFLDHRVLELAASIPSSWRRGKGILKRAMGRLLPPDLLRRGKMGFGVPLKHWFKEDWREYARDLLSSRRARERGFLDPARVSALADAQLRSESGATLGLYSLVVLEEWCRQYLDQPVCPPPGASPERRAETAR